MTAHTQDDGFREIQLNGKQLVFFFMAGTVVLVVVFLCGVLVGRGVRTERGGSGTEIASSVATIVPTGEQPASVAPSAGSDPTKAAPPPPADEALSYNDRLQKSNPPADVLKPSTTSSKAVATPPVEKPAVPPVRAAVPSTDKPTLPVVEKAPQASAKDPVAAAAPAGSTVSGSATSGGTESKGAAYVVQVAALNVRSEADAIAKRLSSKGYDAYVLDSAPGTPQVYRVRVGRFGSRRDAQTMATKLQKEEQFTPWVTR